MAERPYNQDEINKIINSVIHQDTFSQLRARFEHRLTELGITPNQAVDNLEIEYRTLYGILDGSLKRFDMLSLLKIAQFLDIPYAEMVDLYVKATSEKHKEDLFKSRKRSFILNHFDLPALRSMGVIDSIKDFDHIEQRINEIFGLSSITEYDVEDSGAVFSSGAIIPRNLNSRKYFINKSRTIFRKINNPNPYDKEALISYFPTMRFHSIDVDQGLVDVIRHLYTIGITVVFQPKTPNLQLRGATFAVNDKPCIVLMDYKGYYPTLWFGLIHECFHVIFDWEEIRRKKFHLSDEDNDLFIVQQKENEANDFARDYMLPKVQMEEVSKCIHDRLFIKEFALKNKLHHSVIYANYAFANRDDKKNYWAQFNKHMPPTNVLISKLTNDFTNKATVSAFADYYKTKIYNQ